jgi:hypothetical protein
VLVSSDDFNFRDRAFPSENRPILQEKFHFHCGKEAFASVAIEFQHSRNRSASRFANQAATVVCACDVAAGPDDFTFSEIAEEEDAAAGSCAQIIARSHTQQAAINNRIKRLLMRA